MIGESFAELRGIAKRLGIAPGSPIQSAPIAAAVNEMESSLKDIGTGLADVFQSMKFCQSHQGAYQFQYAIERGNWQQAADIARELFRWMKEDPPTPACDVDDRIADLQGQLEEAEEEKENAESEKDDMQSNLDAANKEVSDLERDLEEKDKECYELIGEKFVKEREIKTLKKRIDDLEGELEEAEAQIEKDK